MELLLIFNSSILPIFIIVGIAFFYNRLMRPDIQQIVNMTLMVFVPLFVFDSLIKTRVTIDMLYKPVLFMTLLTGALMLTAHVTAKLMRAGNNERISMILASSMINVGNFGLPLIFFTYGNPGVDHSVLYFVAFNIPLSTVAIYISSNNKKLKNILLDIVKIPIFHAMIIALIFSQMSIQVPEVLEKSIGLAAQATIPLFIFILGLQLSNIRFKFSYITYIFPAVIIRLIISPIIAYLLFEFMGVSGLEKQVAVIQTSAPAAILPLMYAIRFNRSPNLLAAIIMTSTIVSGISLTILIKLLS